MTIIMTVKPANTFKQTGIAKGFLCVYSLYQPYEISFKAANTNMLPIDLALELSLILFLKIPLVLDNSLLN
jgi:hypothetical protein